MYALLQVFHLTVLVVMDVPSNFNVSLDRTAVEHQYVKGSSHLGTTVYVILCACREVSSQTRRLLRLLGAATVSSGSICICAEFDRQIVIGESADSIIARMKTRQEKVILRRWTSKDTRQRWSLHWLTKLQPVLVSGFQILWRWGTSSLRTLTIQVFLAAVEN